jgi:hypothetical protein
VAVLWLRGAAAIRIAGHGEPLKVREIRLKNFKRFTDTRITDIPLSTHLVSLVGPNGCGKSSRRSPDVASPELGTERDLGRNGS